MIRSLNKAVIEANNKIVKALRLEISRREGLVIGFNDEPVQLKFYSDRFNADVFGTVNAKYVRVNSRGGIDFVYSIPVWNEENDYYVTEETSGSIEFASIELLSLDELYNLLDIIKEQKNEN